MAGVFVSCDWGTTRLRVRAVRIADLAILDEFRSLDGVAELARNYGPDERPTQYRALLAAALRQFVDRGLDLAGAAVVISGMASSSIGWHEVPYARLPMPLDGSQLNFRELDAIECEPHALRVALLSGACTATDVMRGEETELVGLFTLPVRELSSLWLVIKPGTHSKHMRVEHGQITGLQTFMTGELHDVLAKHSILTHSIGSAALPLSRETTADLRAGVRHALSLPLAAALFRVRTRQVLDGVSHQRNRAFLDGVLVGNELAYLVAGEFADLSLILCATSPLAEVYRLAGEELGLGERLTVIAPADVETLSVRGQAAWARATGWI